MTGTLAETIMGEAGPDPEAQFAVASVIYNRGQAGTFPGGTDYNSIVNANLQFTGHNSSPNSSAQQFADAIENGTLSDYGNTGNAVNFQSGQTAINNGLTQGGTNIGGNFFSNVLGPPTSSYVAPSYGASSSGGTAQYADTGIGAMTGSVDTTGDVANSGDGLTVQVWPNGSNPTITGQGLGNFGSTTGGTTGSTALPGTGSNQNVTVSPSSAATQTLSGWFGAAEAWLGNAFIVVLLAILGLVFIGGGLFLFGKQQVLHQVLK